jgi:outer membrane protein, heavy metal efflux system
MKTFTNIFGRLLLAAIFAVLPSVSAAGADQPLTLDQLIRAAIEVNPTVRGARERWYSANHQIKQNYVPVDPLFGYSNVDSPSFPLYKASLHTIVAAQSLQFPGKALLQGDRAKLTADIARLAYEAAIRDVRAQVEVAYYQLALDTALGGATGAQLISLGQVLKATQIAYEANQATQADFIAAELNRSVAEQQLQVYKLNVENDRTQLNMLLYRRPDEPLVIDANLELKPIRVPLDRLIDAAAQSRQEIVEASLAARSATEAETLAKMEYLPDYTLTYNFDDYLLASAAPAPNRPEDHTLGIIFNVPIYFWWHQREDVQASLHNLAAARDDLASLKSQTGATVTTLYRTALLDAQQAALYRDSLIPLALQGYQVALVSYQNGKVNFAQLQIAYQQVYALRIAMLQLSNQFLAQRVALEQTIGAPLP